MSESLSEDDFMRKRDNPAVQRRDFFLIDPRVLKVDPNYNVREMDSPETVAHIDALKATIADSGVRTPLQVRLVGDDIFIVSGHCRHAAVMALIAEGRDDLKAVPAVPEPKGTNEVERTLNLHLANASNPLSTLAKAKIVKRLRDFGWEEDVIARRMGWKSRTSVTQALEIVGLHEPMQQRIRKGEISATTARNLAKSDLTPEEQDALIDANLEENKRIKGKRARVTPKAVKRATKPKPPAEVKEDPVVMHAPEPGFMAPVCDEAHEERPSAAPDPRPTETLIEATRNKVQEFHSWNPDEPAPRSPAPQRRDVKDLMEAIAPVATAINLTDLNEIGDDAIVTVEIFGKDAKRLSLLYARATGGEEIAA